METVKDILSLLQSLSILGALIYGIVYLYNQNRTLQTSSDSLRLSNWKEISSLLKEDATVREKIGTFLKDLEVTDALKLDNIRSKYPTGKRAYLSNELKEFREISRHYEYMGASIRLKYLPIDLLNEVVPFPDEFWEKTQCLRESIQANWAGEERPLVGFLENFNWMREQWHSRRLPHKSLHFLENF